MLKIGKVKCAQIPVAILMLVAATILAATATAQQTIAPADVAQALGITRPTGMTPTEASLAVAHAVQSSLTKGGPLAATSSAGAGLPQNMLNTAPFSAAVITTVGAPFSQVSLMGNWDGTENLVADHQGTVDDFSHKIPAGTQGFVLTRAAVSEHTMANGFTENIFYYGDSLGNVYVAANNTTFATPPNILTLNLPTMLNAFGTLNSNDQIVVTGLCVSPVADLSSFSNVNGSFAPFAGLTGEILYVTYWDTGSGFNLLGNNILTRSGLLAIPVADVVSVAAAPPGVQSPLNYPVTVGGAFGVAFSAFSNVAGCAVDDDGSVYFQQVDLIGFTGGNIVKATPVGSNNTRSLATSGFAAPMISLNPANGNYGNSSGPAAQVNHYTNYSGTSTTFGNIAALAAGPGNTLYAALARSFVASDDSGTQATEGLFANPAALGPTPSMIISFADYEPAAAGQLPTADGFADVGAPGLTLNPGVNNFRTFVLGTGPDPRGSSPVLGTTSNTQKVDFQVDYTIFSGLTVDEERKVYVVSGGTPIGVGRNPSPNLGEILVFPDSSPADRRADYIDLRATGVVPNGGVVSNIGDGVSDRFDHIFWQAPLDQLSVAPAGVAGLSRGFLMYLNRTRNNNVNSFVNLPNGAAQAHNATTAAAVNFNDFDLSHQVAGGDVVRSTVVPGGAVNVDYEFLHGAITAGPTCTSPQTSFFLNSNGSVTFGAGDATAVVNAAGFLTGVGRIAGAWADLNPASRGGFPNTFPVQALGFAGINNFKVRWIDVPQTGSETTGSSNSFSISMFDDGTGPYQTLAADSPTVLKATTALRWTVGAGGSLTGLLARPASSANFNLEYGRMDLIGAPATPALAGYTAGTQLASAPGASDVSEAGRTASLGAGVEANLFEFFNTSDYDLRFEGSDATLSTPSTQTDLNREFLGFAGEACVSVGLKTSTTSVAPSANPTLVATALTLTATINGGTGTPTPTGNVTFKDGAIVLGTGALNGSAAATFQTSALTLGTHTISAVYAGDTAYAPSSSSTMIERVVSVLPDYTVTIPSGSATVTAGQSANFTITITPSGGFSSAVNLSCSGLPAQSNCGFVPPALTPSGAVSSALTITTTAHTLASASPAPSILASALTGVGLLGVVIVGGATRRKRVWQSAAMLLVVMAIVAGLAGCGGGGHTPVPNPTTGTPAGTYTVTVTAASGATSHAGTITLTVQ
jgi:Bacterial Ig-like domain (group 3)